MLSTPSMFLLPLDCVISHWLLVEIQFLFMFPSLLYNLATPSVPPLAALNCAPPTGSVARLNFSWIGWDALEKGCSLVENLL